MEQAHVFDAAAADENARRIRDALSQFRSSSELLLQTPNFKECWNRASEIRSMLRELRPLRATVRQELSNELNAICDRLKHQQSELWEKRRLESEQTRDHFLSDLRSIGFGVQGAESRDDVLKADAETKRIRERLVDRHPFSPSQKMLREDRDRCWEQLHEVEQSLGFRRRWLQDLDYGRLSGPIAAVKADAGRDDPFEVFGRIKELQAQLRDAYLTKIQREELRSDLQQAWDHAALRADEKRQERKRRHEEYLNRKRERRLKLEQSLEMFEEMIERKRGVIDRLRANVQKNQDREIWNEEFRAKVDEWIADDEEKIASIEVDIAEIEGKLRNIRERLRETED